MTKYAAKGTTVSIGPIADATVDLQAEYEALSYTAIGEIEDVGDFGDQSNLITGTAINDGRVQKKKGSKDANTFDLTMFFDDADAGQQALDSAEDQPFEYAFKITLPTGGSGSPSSPSTFYFRGMVSQYRVQPGNVDSLIRAIATIAINSDIVKVAAV